MKPATWCGACIPKHDSSIAFMGGGGGGGGASFLEQPTRNEEQQEPQKGCALTSCWYKLSWVSNFSGSDAEALCSG